MKFVESARQGIYQREGVGGGKEITNHGGVFFVPPWFVAGF
jgi:hypothetical protein